MKRAASLGRRFGPAAEMMVVFLERQVSTAAIWARRLALFSAVLFLTAGLGHRLGLVESRGFIAVLGLVAVLVLLALLLCLRGGWRVWNYGDVGGRRVASAVLVAAVLLVPYAVSAYRAAIYPMLTDISTDLDDPPALLAATRLRSPDMNPVTSYTAESRQLQIEGYPLVTGRRYDIPFLRAVEAVETVVADQGWQIVSGKPVALDSLNEVTIEAVAGTLVFGFPVDVAIRLTDEETSTYVDMRSASRFGVHDFGDNAERIEAFLDALDVEISSLAGVTPPEPADPAELDPPTPEPRPDM